MPGFRWRAQWSFSTRFTRSMRAVPSAGAPMPPEVAEAVDYGRTNEGEAAENWRRSPFFHLLQSGEQAMRRCLVAGDPADFPTIAQARDEGTTDYPGARSSICRRGRHRRDGLRLFSLVDRCGGRLRRGRASPR